MSSYVEISNEVEHEALRRRLADAGVFDEADEVFDAVERGEDPLSDRADAHELVERFKLTRG